MTVLFPTDVDEALSALSDPELQVLAGGTDFMVEVNAGRRQPAKVLSLNRIRELRTWQRRETDDGPEVRLGATVTYAQMLAPPLAELVPALAQAARSVGSPQIRNAGTIGGNLATASPAGDTLPVLAALDAVIEVGGPDGGRDVAVGAFVTGPKRNALKTGELVVAVRLPILGGHQEFRKVGVRNAMVIAVASLALAVDTRRQAVRCALGSVGPGPLRARAAEAWLAQRVDWGSRTVDDPAVPAEFGRLVAEAARPIDDHRSTAAYRGHAIEVLARRSAANAFPSATRAAP